MIRFFPLFLIILTISAEAGVKKLHLFPAPKAIVVDGAIDEAWAAADSATDFFQLDPFFGKTPTRRTTAKVLTTSDALYCIMICYDSSGTIQHPTGVLDQGDGDIVSIMLDSFDDKQSAYKFAVTAAGVRADCRLLDDARNRDYSWNGIWFAATQMYDWGFVVEWKIPYNAMRFNPTLREWGLDFDRWVATTKEDLYWSPYQQNEGQRISKFSRLDLGDFRPNQTGLGLEVYPVGLLKANDLTTPKVKIEPDAGIDIFYNPSEQLTFQLTGNPDFAQIEADPFAFNISRYETYFNELRPFFTEGSEIFTAAGRSRNTGFYRPLELLYTRRIGRILPGGTQVPLTVGTKAFGRIDDWEYGAFFAATAETPYREDDVEKVEPHASFVSARLKKTIFDNSSVGVLFAGKQSGNDMRGVFDVDGALRTSGWQLAYQLAHSIDGHNSDFGGSLGFISESQTMLAFARVRAIGKQFDVSEIGYVPWQGTSEVTLLAGPIFRYDTGWLRSQSLYGIASATYKDVELFTDRALGFGWNVSLRNNCGGEIDATYGRSKDDGVVYTNAEIDISTWVGVSATWSLNVYGGYAHTYNFSRDYLAGYWWIGVAYGWKVLPTLEVGTTYNMFTEGNPEGHIEDITYNARPYVSLTPVNDLNVRVYFDNTFVRSSDKIDGRILGFLFSYNFMPKSWIYFAFNQGEDRSDEYDIAGNLLPRRLHVVDRAAVLKVKYLYYM